MALAVEFPERHPRRLLPVGHRSATAAAIMVEVGLTDVSNAGGYDDLAAAGLETEKS